MKTYIVYLNAKDDIEDIELNDVEMDVCEKRQDAVDSMKKMVRNYERSLREIDGLPVVYWDEGTNEVWGNDGFGHYVSYSFYVRRTELAV